MKDANPKDNETDCKEIVVKENKPTPDKETESEKQINRFKLCVRYAKEDQKGIGEFIAEYCRNKLLYDRSCKKWYIYEKPVWRRDICDNHKRVVEGLQTEFKICAELIKYSLQMEQKKGDYNYYKSGDDSSYIHKGTVSSVLYGIWGHPRLTDIPPLLLSRAADLNTTNYRDNCFKFATYGDIEHGGLSISGDEWNRDNYLIGCLNGTLDLRTGELREGSPEDYISFQAPVNYNPNAECPHFEKFVREILGDDEEIYCFVRRLFGLSLIGDGTKKQYFVVMHGRGRNGKGTLMETIHHVFGNDYAGKIDPSLLLGRIEKGAGPELASLKNKRLVYTEESNEGARLNAAAIKQITGGGQILGRGLYEDPETFDQKFMLFFETNSLPELSNSDYGLDKRMIRIDFPLSYVEKPVKDFERKLDPQLPARLREETEGIFNWLVRGCLEFIDAGEKLNIPESIKKLNEEYSREFDTVAYFIEKRCVLGDGEKQSSAELYEKYEKYMREADKEKLGKNTFFRELKDRKYERKKDGYGIMCFYGIRGL